MPEDAIKTEILVHDLKVPVSIIDAGAKSLLRRQDVYGPLTDKQVKVINRIIRNTITTQRLVNDVLELGRSREGVMINSDFLVGDLIKSVLIEIFDLSNPGIVDDLKEARGYDQLIKIIEPSGFRLAIGPQTWKKTVHLDKAKVKQVLRNLTSNAFKHKSSLVEIAGRISDNCLEMTVKDDGPGIPQKDHQKIFETYFTTGSPIENAIESHGLGLAGVMVLLKDMGGRLVFHSGAGEGCEFTVTIPLS